MKEKEEKQEAESWDKITGFLWEKEWFLSKDRLSEVNLIFYKSAKCVDCYESEDVSQRIAIVLVELLEPYLKN